MSKAQDTATAFLSAATAAGFFVLVQKDQRIVRISKQFPKGNAEAYADCDMQGPRLLSMLDARGGSMWGSTGDSVGGAVALQKGHYHLKVSGVPQRVVNVLNRMA